MAFARTLRRFEIVEDRYWFHKDLMIYWLHNNKPINRQLFKGVNK